MPESPVHTGADALLQALLDRGIETVFCNLGTDHAPLIEACARWQRSGRQLPRLILCPHENTALHMAMGHAAATGRGQAVLVHVDAGTANAVLGLHNAFRARLPVLLLAGRAPYTTRGDVPGGRDTYVHFIQEPFDQAGLARPYVKWEYTLPSPDVVDDVVSRAISVMHSDPMGPAYLMLPREVLAAPTAAPAGPACDARAHRPVRAGGAPGALLRDIAERLLASTSPLLITAYAGRQAAAVGLLDELARTAGIRVCVFNPSTLSFPPDSPCFGGFAPGRHVAEADFGLMVDVDVPWIPATTDVRADAYWVQMDVDASKRDIPLWSFPADVRIEGDSVALLAGLLAEVRALMSPAQQARAQERVQRMAQAHAEQRAVLDAMAREPGSPGAVNPAYLLSALGRALAPDDIVVNEAVTHALLVWQHLGRCRPGTMLGLAGGGLGFSSGAALGVKLARPACAVVNIVGDGTFHLSDPSSVYGVASQYRLPIFTVVLDNGGWAAVQHATQRMYPGGEADARDEHQARITPAVDFARLAGACGAHGERVSVPAEIEAAIARCMRAIGAGQSAVLHVDIARLGGKADRS